MLEEDAEVTMEELKEAVEELKKINKEKFMTLSSKQMTLDPSGVMLTRLETLLDFLLDEKMKLLFEYKFESEIGHQLQEAVTEVNRMQLLEGVSGVNPSSLTIPGR